MGIAGKVTSILVLAFSLSTVAADSWGPWPRPTPTSSSHYSSSSSSNSSSTSIADPRTAWPAPTDPSSSTSATSYLATITPCPWCPSHIAPPVQNITQQLQAVSSCSAATSVCSKGKCHTRCPYSSWQWVSTTIPCSFNNFSKSASTGMGSSCLVTKTEDCVPVLEFRTTRTSYTLTTWTTTTYITIPVSSTPSSSTAWPSLVSTTSTPAATTSRVIEVTTSPVPVYEYIEKDYCAVFSGLGPLAMLDHYDGSGLCTTCGAKGVGLTQAVTATECRTGDGFASTSCVTYVETWISEPAPLTTLVATWSSRFYTSGSWDVTFTGPVPAQTTSAQNGPITSEPTSVPWVFHGSCSHGPSTVDFTTTATTKITVRAPLTTHTDPYTGGWGDWTSTGSTTAHADPSRSTRSTMPTTHPNTSWSALSTNPQTSAGASSGMTNTTPESSADPSWGTSNTPTNSADPSVGAWGTSSTKKGATSTCSKSTATGYIKVVDLSQRYHNRHSHYISFSNGDGVVVDEKNEAAPFVYGAGYLSSGGEYIAGDGIGYSPFEKSPDKPSNGTWTIHGGTEYGALISGSDGFCESSLGSLFIEYDSSPGFVCPRVWLQFVPLSGPTPPPVWPTSTASTWSHTWTYTSASASSTSITSTYISTSTTSANPTLDPSSDPDMPDEPDITPTSRVRRGFLSDRTANAHFL